MKSGTEQFAKVALSALQQHTQPTSAGKSTKKQKSTKLNMFGKGITHIKPLLQQKQHLIHIKQLDLSHNAISNIQNLKVLPLQELNLSHNKIQDQQTLLHIFVQDKNNQLTKNIRKISLKGNPFLKSNLLPQLKRWLFGVQNDLDLFMKEQNDYLDILLQQKLENISLTNLMNKLLMNTQLLRSYEFEITDNYEQLLLLRPQSFLRLLKRQQQKSTGLMTYLPQLVRRQIISNLPLQLFSVNTKQKTLSSRQFPCRLAIYLRDCSQNVTKQNKQITQKIQNHVFNYITLKKMLLQKKQKHSLNLKSLQHGKKTSSKINNSFSIKRNEEQNIFSNNKSSSQYKPSKYQNLRIQQAEQVNTPTIYIKKLSPQKVKITVSQNQTNSNYSPFQFTLSTEPRVAKRVQHQHQQVQSFKYSTQRNPFEQIMKQQQQNKHVSKLSLQKYKKTEDYRSPKSSNKIIRFQNKTTSKTLFQLSQSLLQQRNVAATSDRSLNFQLIQQNPAFVNSQSSIQKMFFQILCKINPIYNLLYSPLQSLKSSEKDSLINNLLQLLKQKFKHIQKIQKYKVLYEDVQNKYQQLKSYYQVQKKCNQTSVQKFKYISKQMQQNQRELQKLSNQIQSKTQQNFKLKEQINSLDAKLKTFIQIKLSKSYQQECQEKIREIRQKKLKAEYFKILNKKAHKLYRYQNSMEDINKSKDSHLLETYFRALKKQTSNSKKIKQIRRKLMSRKFHLISQTMKSTLEQSNLVKIKAKQLLFKLRKTYLQNFIKISIQSKHKQLKLTNTINHYNLKLKSKLFQFLKDTLQITKGVQHQRIIQQFRIQQRCKFKKYVFNEWLVWQKGLLHKQVEIRVNHEGVLACNVVQNLCNYYSKSRAYQNKAVALELFLRDMRKMNYFHKFYMNISLQTRKSKLKLFKINMFTKKIFFQDFMQVIRKRKLKKKMKERQQKLTRRKLFFNQLDQTKIRRRINAFKTCKTLRSVYFEQLKQQMIQVKKSIDLENNINNNYIKSCFQQLSKNHKHNWIIKQKSQNLYYHLKNARQNVRTLSLGNFFDNLKKEHKFRHSFKLFFINKNKRLMSKAFYNFRVVTLQQRALYFQQRLRELGPQIDLIQKRQIQTNIEKVSLMRQLELKHRQAEQYEKQIEQLKMLLQAKQIKYQKLKDIYSESIELNSRQHDILEMEDSKMFPEYIPYDYQNYSNISNIKIPERIQDNYLLKTIRNDSKFDLSRNNINVNLPSAHTVKYSPQRDVKKSKEKRKISDFVLESKSSQYSYQNLSKKKQQDKYDKNNSNEFYPSFRRF